MKTRDTNKWLTAEEAKELYPHVTFKGRVKIGNDVEIRAGVVIGNDVEIGDYVTIWHCVKIWDNVEVI